MLLRAYVADQVRRAVGVTIDVAVEACNALAWAFGAPIVGQVELLLSERREQQAEPVELLGVQDALEQLEEVIGRYQLPLRHVAQVGARRQKNGRRKLRQKLLGQVEVEIEASKIAAGLFQDLIDRRLREQHAAFGLLGMRQRTKTARK